MNILEIENLQVQVDSKIILKDLTLKINSREAYVLFGPNGSGKTTLINAIIGASSYKVNGSIRFMGEEIIDKTVDERAKLGISIAATGDHWCKAGRYFKVMSRKITERRIQQRRETTDWRLRSIGLLK
jgi:Fe-S cluster assembly ATPase SufC